MINVSSKHTAGGKFIPEILNSPGNFLLLLIFERRSSTSCRYSCFFLRAFV